jgi:hypothetical protein
MTISFRDINFLFWIPFIRTLCILSYTSHINTKILPILTEETRYTEKNTPRLLVSYSKTHVHTMY